MVWAALAVLFCLFLVVAAILSYVNQGKITDLLRELATLRQQINQQGSQIARLKHLLGDTEKIVQPSTANTPGAEPDPLIKVSSHQPIASATASTTDRAADSLQPVIAAAKTIPAKPNLAGDKLSQPFTFERFIKSNGLLWLGGLILAIGGIFLAKYSAEAGLLPPYVRVIMGGVFGVLLVVVAEYLSRHAARFNIHSAYVCAALASGGVITCYAIVMVAYDYYAFITATFAFGLLATISLASTSLSLRFGPLLAWIGIIGAYAVPALVSTGSGNVVALLVYTAVISASAVWVSHTVHQAWLWWLSFVAHFTWFGISLSLSSSSHFALISLFALVSVYLYVLSDILGWAMRARSTTALPIKDLLMPRKEHLGVVLPLLAIVIFLYAMGSTQQVVIASILVSAVLCYLPHRHSAFDPWPFLALAFLLYAFTLLPAPQSYTDGLFPFRGGYLFVQLAALSAIAYSLLMLRYWQRPGYLLLLVLGPISLFGVSYALAPDQASQYLYPVWAIYLILIAFASTMAAARSANTLMQVTLAILANASVTLCLTMLLDAATLSLAIAIQIASMSYLSWKYRVELPAWLYKAALIVVLMRLTFAPWLDDYVGQHILGLRWTIVLYPAVLAILWFARHYNSSSSFRVWLEGAVVHVLALFVTTETSYMLVGHYPQFFNLSFNEAALLAMNWLLLAGVYLWRAKKAVNAPRLYCLFAAALITGAGVLHLDVSLFNNPFLQQVLTGDGIVINWLLVLWALPAFILLTLYQLGLIAARFQAAIKLVTGVLLFMYINGAIRGAYHSGQLVLNGYMPQAELYTYSIVWLIIATAMVFTGQHIKRVTVSNLGFGILAVVLLKAFLIDMANLAGLYRAISFIGLGLSLVAIGWLYQKLNYEDKQTAADS